MHTFAKLSLFTALLGAPLMASAHADDMGRHGPQPQACREFTQRVTINGRTQTAYGTACQTRDGDWKIVNREENRRAELVKRHYRHERQEDCRDDHAEWHPHRRYDDRNAFNQRSQNITWSTQRGW